jgi:hypothetical protein
VFQHIFANKGYALGQWKVLDKEDFPVKFFFQPTPWDVLLDLHGQGTKIFYPIKAKQGISSHGPQRDLLGRTILS